MGSSVLMRLTVISFATNDPGFSDLGPKTNSEHSSSSSTVAAHSSENS